MEPIGVPPKRSMLPAGAATVAALLRGSFNGVPGNHVSGAAAKFAEANAKAIPGKRRKRNPFSRSVLITAAIGFSEPDENVALLFRPGITLELIAISSVVKGRKSHCRNSMRMSPC